MIRFIDEHKDRRSGQLRWGIEPIAQVLGIAPSTYHAAKTRPLSARAIRDSELKPQILRMWEENLSVYGADKVWDQLNKDGVTVTRCTIERLMADLGLQGCRRSPAGSVCCASPRVTPMSLEASKSVWRS